MDGDEQKLIVFWAIAQRLLQLQQLIDLQVGGVADMFVVSHLVPQLSIALAVSRRPSSTWFFAL